MLQPIKTFFNYLQKNANSSAIFRLSTDLNMTDENNTPDGIVEGEIFEDPLTDPLAIDEVELISSNAELDNCENGVNNFVFVDIEKLKCKSSENLSIDEKLKKKVIKENDINQKNTSGEGEKKEIENNYDESGHLDSLLTNQKIDKIENGDNQQKSCNESKKIENCLSSEVDTDEVDGFTLLEEVRSDGSDSGYAGSETLRNILELEKNLASLTPGKSNLKRKSMDHSLHEEQQPKKVKQSINFGNVTVFYFPRCQGFGCVPTQGGSTLGMVAKHAYKKTFTLIEHANEQRRLNRLKITRNELNSSSSSSDESKSEEDHVESLSEAENEVYGFLQPKTARQRRVILKTAGVRKIDLNEKDDCREIRISREVCGCACPGSYCDPDTCECSLSGIKCQVDRLKPREFPCGCNRDGCGNINGRIEFNPARVKTHFIHTIMRLELEKRQELSEEVANSSIQNASTKWWTQLRSTHTLDPNASSNRNYNYIYNGILESSSQYSGKIPSLANQDSLDFHYAYREEYTNPLSLSDISGSGTNDYFSSYNYVGSTAMPPAMGTSTTFQNNFQSTSTYHQHPNYANTDCQYNYHVSEGVNNYQNSYNCSSAYSGVIQSSTNYQSSTLPKQCLSSAIESLSTNQDISFQNVNLVYQSERARQESLSNDTKNINDSQKERTNNETVVTKPIKKII